MNLQTHYNEQIKSKLKDELGLSNVHAVPSLEKITVNVGTGSKRSVSKITDLVSDDLARITGQKPVKRAARKAVAGFKLREGEAIGVSVVLRGLRMYDFLERLIRVTLPRIRDFRGLSGHGFDGHGNYSLGIREHTVFAEIDHEKVQELYGLGITITTTAKSDADAKKLLVELGMPFQKEERGGN